MTGNAKRHLVPLALALLSAGAGARAEIVDIVWGGDGRFEHAATLAPGKFLELCGPMVKGESVAWSFKAEQPLDFNIHYHAGSEVVYPAQRTGVAALEGRLDVSLDQAYCWMWSNPAERPVALRVSLVR